MKLVEPCEKYLDSYYQGCVESWGRVHDNYILHNPEEYDDWKSHIFQDYENQKNGINLPDGFVPNATYWLVDGDDYLGTVNIRLQLTDRLIEYGGNCGIVLRVRARGKGLGVKLAELAFEKMKELKLSPIVLTCEEKNKQSWHIIEHFDYKKCEKYKTEINGIFTFARRYFL